jgi:hypothetical protein
LITILAYYGLELFLSFPIPFFGLACLGFLAAIPGLVSWKPIFEAKLLFVSAGFFFLGKVIF